MSKLYRFVFIVLSFYCSISYAQWISLDSQQAPFSSPTVKLLSDDPQSTVIKFDIAGFEIKEINADGKTYQSINILSESVTTETGHPEIPYLSKVIAVPNNSGITVEVLEKSTGMNFKNFNIAPARASWIEGDEESQYIENSEAYLLNKSYPEELVKIEDPVVFRDFRLVRVSVFPVRYYPVKKEIEAFSSITVKIKYTTGDVVNPKTTPRRKISPSFAKIYKSIIFNYDEVLARDYSGREEGIDVMLCIVPDEFYSTFKSYAEWRQKSGTLIHITKFSDMGANASDPTIIKNYIQDAYQNWEDPPTYILIIGDDGIAPVKYVVYDFTFVNEDYFVELEGNDYLPEMMIGRITNQNNYQLQVMLNKFQRYEEIPYTAQQDWFKKATVCSNNQYISQVQTKRTTAQLMMDNGHFLSVDTLMSDGYYGGVGCTVDLSDILATIDEGRSFLNYRGEGWSSGWYANCYAFQTSDVSTLNNGEMLTFVTSIGCGVAMFNELSGNCFGEQWLELGSVTSPRGACAFVGPTSNTHTLYNNYIDLGIYTGMFTENLDTPGEALLRGKLYMYSGLGNTYWVEYHYRIYCVLGDPGLHIWKDVPRAVNVNHPPNILFGYNQIEIGVTDQSSGLPLEDAQVCISGDNLFITGMTNSAGIALMDVFTEEADTLSIVVRGGNIIPYENEIHLIAGAENIGPEGEPVVIDIDGNLDGKINPNENCTITYTLKNWGYQTSENVQATLTVSDTMDYVQIISTGPSAFGNIAPNTSVTGSPLQFYVKPECPIGYIIPLNLHITSSTSSWDFIYQAEVKGCRLDYSDNWIDDLSGIFPNYRMDPGETVNLIMKIENKGEDFAENVMGILRTDDEYITIVDSVGQFGTIIPDSNSINDLDYFIVSISPDCPLQHIGRYSVIISTQNGNYPYSVLDTFSIPVALPGLPDPTGPDDYGYYAYSSDDINFHQSPVYNWKEIDGIGTEIPMPSGVSNFSANITLPFNFSYYGNSYSQLRICSNGWIAFGSGNQTASTNTQLPKLDDLNNIVAAFWDNFFSPFAPQNGKLLYYYDSNDHCFIIEWDEVAHVTNYNYLETFEIILFDPQYYATATGDGEIVIQYKYVTEESGCTVGIENETELIGLQYVFDSFYDITAQILKNEFAVKFTTEEPTLTDVDEKIIPAIPSAFKLQQNYPNPFNPSTTISYDLPYQTNVILKIYNILGEEVRTLVNEFQSAGSKRIVWNGKDEMGRSVSSGVYIYSLVTSDRAVSRKMVLVK